MRPPSAPPGYTDRNRAIAAGIALVALAVAAYIPALTAGFIWDDDAYVSDNPLLRDADGLRRIWAEPTASPQYYPLVFTTFWTEYRVWGLTAGGYHFTNVLLHGLNGVLLWRVLKALGVPVPWFVAAAFVLHPVHVESVAWITERKNVLSGTFYLGAALAYFRFSPPGPAGVPPPHRWRWYALAVGLFVCALLSKTVTCSLPAAVLVVVWWKRGRIGWRDVLPLLPLFAVGLAFALNTAWMEKEHVGAKGQDWSLTPAERVLVAGRAVVFYATSLVFPVNLTFIYPRWVVSAGEWWQWLFPLAVVGAMAGLWVLRERVGRGPLAGLFFFAGTLVPALGFVDVYPFRFSFVADHFQYLASIGLLAAVFAGGSVLWQRYRPADRVVLPVARAVVLLAFGGLTLYYTPRYESAQTLWEDTIARNPGCWAAHNNLGDLLVGRGVVAEKKGRTAEAGQWYKQAEPHFRETIRLKPEVPGHHYNLGKALWSLDRYDEAEKHLREAIRLAPDYTASRFDVKDAHFILGLVLRKQAELNAAVEGIGKAKPDAAKLDAAIDEFRAAIRIQPTFADAHANLGIALGMKERHVEALDEFLAAIDLEPNNPATQFNLARAYLYLDRPADALPFAQRAVQLDPKKPEFRQLLDHLLAGGGKP